MPLPTGNLVLSPEAQTPSAKSWLTNLLTVRCRSDRICPRAKIERLRREFPTGLQIREYAEPEERNALGERPHATFTREYRLAPDAPADHYSRRAFADLVAFFSSHLRT